MTQITLLALQKVGGKERLKIRVLRRLPENSARGDGADVTWRASSF